MYHWPVANDLCGHNLNRLPGMDHGGILPPWMVAISFLSRENFLPFLPQSIPLVFGFVQLHVDNKTNIWNWISKMVAFLRYYCWKSLKAKYTFGFLELIHGNKYNILEFILKNVRIFLKMVSFLRKWSHFWDIAENLKTYLSTQEE